MFAWDRLICTHTLTHTQLQYHTSDSVLYACLIHYFEAACLLNLFQCDTCKASNPVNVTFLLISE